jgi:phosphoglycerate kinase
MEPVRACLKKYINAPEVELLENLRFNPGEEANDHEFAKKLASLGDIFVQDAFADLHRAHASIVGIPKLLPSYAGLLVEKEIEHLGAALTPPPHAIAIIGGAKFETKEPLLAKLLSLYEKVLLGGALADDLIKARGMPFGASLVSGMSVPTLLAGNKKLIIPTDAVVVLDEKTPREALVSDVRAQERMVDIGQATAKSWAEIISQASFVLWNGPMGVYEKSFIAGTDALAQALVDSYARAVVGGGDTLASIKKYQFDPSKVFLSTGGGAMLKFLTDGTLVGIDALKS